MQPDILLIITGMAVVTCIPRIVPLVALSRISLPSLVLEWLEFIPAAILAALLASIVLVEDGHLNIAIGNRSMWAAVPCFFVAIRTRNLARTVLVGLAAMAVLNNLC